MYLDIVDNLPRCRFTGAQLSLILHLLKCVGAKNVPSLKAFRKLQNTLQTQFQNINSALGNIFYINDVRDTIARDLANPAVASKMQLYPEEVDGRISETWQADRWKEYSPSLLTPMYSTGLKRFWIEELACLRDGRFAVPSAWIVRNGVLTADARVVTRSADSNVCWNYTDEKIIVPANTFDRDYGEILAEFGPDIVWTNMSGVPLMPNGQRQLVDDDEDLVVVMITAWADDVSGNKSKQYNKHMNMYVQNGCLPGRLLQQEYHVHYASTSPHASSGEQFAAFRDQVKSTELNPVRCWNAHKKRKTRFILRAPGLPADNPQQSEEACHIGCQANHPCRKCHWGGTMAEKPTTEIYHKSHFPDIARNANEIRQCLQEQLRLATHGDKNGIAKLQTKTGTKDKIAQHWIELALAKFKSIQDQDPGSNVATISPQVQAWLDEQPGDKMNPLLDITGLDPSQDTPVELLHTVLLGVVKYIWHHMNTARWSDADRQLLAIRLQSTDLSGLSVPPIRGGYMIQYRNNLIGKHFKTLMQVLSFHVHGIGTADEFTLIKSVGDLGARLWIPEIDNMDMHLPQLNLAIANVLDAFDAVDPLRIIVKIKLHLLTHIPADIKRFGPAVHFSTEIFEAYNAVFRMCSINSNHQAPSRDISRKFASMERVKHWLSGGFWWNPQAKEWTRAGVSVRKILRDDPVCQRHLGWVSSKPREAGMIVFASRARFPDVLWNTTRASLNWKLGAAPEPGSLWRWGKSVAAQCGDQVSLMSWAYATDLAGNYVLGRVVEILGGTEQIITLEQFVCSGRHPDFGWPLVRRPNGEDIAIHGQGASSLQFICSVQHDCRKGGCQPAVIGKERQEREDTNRDRSLIKHTDDDHFVLNMGGLHNMHYLLRVLPISLSEIKPLQTDRVEFHRTMAVHSGEQRMTKRKKTAAKRQAKAEEKRKEAERAAAEAEEATQAAARAAALVDAPGDVDGEDEQDSDSDAESIDPESEESELEDAEEYGERRVTRSMAKSQMQKVPARGRKR
ncbi:hypothetical protein GGX14DRAFT_368317 [Mycena pura]|uniref:Uncharacterized protein n=1 Tax=Mycena pura TaxID=153505 RepID=A0AAD6YA48_9AGAR|nr:hypothetical protein GGX14DRAFT_368317 [Mycena pura]